MKIPALGRILGQIAAQRDQMAQADLLPPALAAWTANIVFAGIGAALFLSART